MSRKGSTSATIRRRERAAWRSPASSTANRGCATSPPRSQIARQGGKAGIVGYCLGGTVAWAAAARVAGLSAAVCYYGGGIVGLKDLRPRVPTLLHFGEKDAHIPLEGVREVAAAHPEVEVRTYPAEHGFNCDHRESYDAPSAALAWTRTLAFFAKHLG